MPTGKKADIMKGLDPDMFSSGLFDGDEPDEPSEDLSQVGEVDVDDLGVDNVASAASAPLDESAEEEEGDDSKSGTQATLDTFEDDIGTEEAEESEEEVAAAPTAIKHTPSKAKRVDATKSAPTYVVQRGFVGEGGKTFHSGDVIPVKCKYCALWNTKVFDKVLCYAGREFADGTRAHEDMFSCESFFICQELAPELTNFLKMSPHEVIAVKRMLPGLKRMFDALRWIENYSKKVALDEGIDIYEIFRNARGFVMSFTSKEQVLYAEDFIRFYSKQHSSRVQPNKLSKIHFRGGDWVEWTDQKHGKRVSGVLLTNFRGNVTIAGLHQLEGVTLKFDLKEWLAKCEPTITRKSAAVE